MGHAALSTQVLHAVCATQHVARSVEYVACDLAHSVGGKSVDKSVAGYNLFYILESVCHFPGMNVLLQDLYKVIY